MSSRPKFVTHTGSLKGLAIVLLRKFSTLRLTIFEFDFILSSGGNLLISGVRDVNLENKGIKVKYLAGMSEKF